MKARILLALLAGGILIATVLLIGVVLAPDGGRTEETAMDVPVTIFPSPPLLVLTSAPSSPSVPPYSPQIEPGHALVEATLFDLQNDRSFNLWQPGDDTWISPPSFSNDGRYIVFAQTKVDFFRVKLVDLQAPTLEPVELGEGYMPSISPDGRTIAVGHRDRNNFSTIEIWLDRGNGRRFTLDANAFGASWSPDSRWLAYQRYIQTEDLIDIILVDTQTWQQQKVGTSIPCQCDGARLPQWASNSRLFLYSAPLSGSGIISLDGLPVDDLPPAIDWNPDGVRYLWQRTTRTDKGLMFEVGIYNLTNGQSTVLLPAAMPGPETTAATGNASWSRDGALVLVGVNVNGTARLRAYSSAGHPFADVSSAFVNTPSGDGRFLMSYHSSSCSQGLSVSLLSGVRPSTWRGTATCAPVDVSGEFSQGSWSLARNDYAFATQRPLSTPPPGGPVEATDIYLLDAETLTLRPLATDLRGVSCETWSPDGRYVLFHGCGL